MTNLRFKLVLMKLVKPCHIAVECTIVPCKLALTVLCRSTKSLDLELVLLIRHHLEWSADGRGVSLQHRSLVAN
jgi:hypothetical protein